MLFNDLQTEVHNPTNGHILMLSPLILANVLEYEEVKFNRFKRSCLWAVIGASLTPGLFFCTVKPHKTLSQEGEQWISFHNYD